MGDPLSNTHHGAIHDLQWSRSDAFIACASGDGFASVYDTQANKTMAILSGHSGAVKCVGWSVTNPGIVYTGGRDGEILLWDLRVSETGRIINRMKEAPSKRSKGDGTTKSVTAIIQATGGQRELISASSYDG